MVRLPAANRFLGPHSPAPRSRQVMAEVRRLTKPPIVACDHPECRGTATAWLAEPRAGSSPIHLAEYRQFPIRRSDFEKKEDRLCQVVLAKRPGESQFVVCVAPTCAFLAPPVSSSVDVTDAPHNERLGALSNCAKTLQDETVGHLDDSAASQETVESIVRSHRFSPLTHISQIPYISCLGMRAVT